MDRRRLVLVSVLALVVGLTLVPTAAADGHCRPTCIGPLQPAVVVDVIAVAGLATVAVATLVFRWRGS